MASLRTQRSLGHRRETRGVFLRELALILNLINMAYFGQFCILNQHSFLWRNRAGALFWAQNRWLLAFCSHRHLLRFDGPLRHFFSVLLN